MTSDKTTRGVLDSLALSAAQVVDHHRRLGDVTESSVLAIGPTLDDSWKYQLPLEHRDRPHGLLSRATETVL